MSPTRIALGISSDGGIMNTKRIATILKNEFGAGNFFAKEGDDGRPDEIHVKRPGAGWVLYGWLEDPATMHDLQDLEYWQGKSQ